MPSTLAAIGAVDGVDHLADVARFRARPRVRAAEQFARVLDAVLGRDEERVRRDVVDEREFVAFGASRRSCCAPLLESRSNRRRQQGCRPSRPPRPVSAVRRRNVRRSNPGRSAFWSSIVRNALPLRERGPSSDISRPPLGLIPVRAEHPILRRTLPSRFPGPSSSSTRVGIPPICCGISRAARTTPAGRHERRMRVWHRPHPLALALALYLRNMSTDVNGRWHPRPT